jgi:hypothetical protein
MNAWMVGISSFLGGTGLVALLRYFLKNKEMILSNEAALRAELQAQIQRLTDRVAQLEADRDA